MMQIKTIILYGYNGKKREIPLSIGRVNIITGRSKTGKSVIGDIIDYCLGGESCNIAEGIVRRSVSWYALLLQFDSEQMLVARRNPAPQYQSSSEFYYEIANAVIPPEPGQFISNADTSTIEYILSNRLGIKDNLFTPPSGHTREPIRANIRHALSFCFQKQSVVADNTQLFHRQGETFVAQSIKDTLPYFWGVVDDKLMQLEAERTQLKREITLIRRELSEQEAITGIGLSRAYSLLSEAHALGMIPDYSFDSSPLTLQQAICALNRVLEWTPSSKNNNHHDRLSTLQSEADSLTNQIAYLEERIAKAKRYIGEDDSYTSQVREQKLRLESIGLFERMLPNTCTCPICASKADALLPNAEQIKAAIIKLDETIGEVERERPQLVQHILDMTKERDSYIEKRSQIERDVHAIIVQHAQDKLIADRNAKCGRVIGRISLWLESVEAPQDNSLMKERLKQKEDRLKEIEERLSADDTSEKIDSILSLLSQDMTKWAQELQLEHLECPYRFDYKKMTVIVDIDRPVPLRQIGSGSNWLGIHLITYFALQKYFITHSRPVPQFIFLDQLSQVYFPAEDDEQAIKNQDLEEVARLYRFIFNRVSELNGMLQVIVVDHAKINNEEFKAATIDDWWHGETLVPNDWDPKKKTS